MKISRLRSSTVELCVRLLSQLVHHQLLQISLCVYSMKLLTLFIFLLSLFLSNEITGISSLNLAAFRIHKRYRNFKVYLLYKIISERFRRGIHVLESTKNTAVLSKWESANIDFICFANKGDNHRHRKSRRGIPRDSPRFVFQFAQAAVDQFLR